jgi:TonB family protein
VHFIARRNTPSYRTVFSSVVLGLALATGSHGSIADTSVAPDIDSSTLSTIAQEAVPANDARVTVIADAATSTELVRESIRPLYPERARRDGIEGYVVVQFDITKSGMVSGARVIEAKPVNYFETAAMDAVRQFQFSPNDNAPDPVAIRGAVNKFVFSLHAPNTPVKPGFIYYRGRTYFALAE